MEWNIKEVSKELTILSSKDFSIQQQLEESNYIDMINYHHHRKILPESKINESIFDKKREKDNIQFIIDTLPTTALDISYIGYIHALPTPMFISNKISEEEYCKTIESFFALVNPTIRELLTKYIKEERIELRPYDCGKGVKGRCYNFNESSCYLSSQFKKNFKISTLVHELGHAYSFDNISSNIKSQNIRHSVFVEAIPIYYELLFSDYLKLLGSPKEAIYIKNQILNNLIIILDCCLTELANPKLDNNHIPKYIRLFYSLLMALKLYYISSYDLQLATKLVEDLNNMIGHNNDREIFNYFKLNDSKSFIDEIINTCNQQYRQSKK